MRRTKKIFTIGAIAALTLGTALSCAADDTMTSYLTGKEVSVEQGMRRPIAFTIDNVTAAVPQSGISKADMYYECEVETDLSRITAVFEQYDGLEKIGPLRSCRDYFISLVAGLDPIYEHYGQAAYALSYLESDDVDNISGLLSYGVEGFFRAGPHEAPHNAYTSGDGMDAMIEAAGYRTEHEEDYEPMLHFHEEGEAGDTAEGKVAKRVELGYPHNNPYFIYDSDSKLYYRYQNGSAHIDLENDEQLSVRNIILEYQNGATYEDSIYLHYITYGKGKGKYIADGKSIDIVWERDDFYSPVRYTTKDGEELKLQPGKTWVAVIRNNQLGECMIGSDEDNMRCVATEKTVAAAAKMNAEWEEEYRANEPNYLAQKATEREENVLKHGGKTKVEVGLP